MECFQNNIILYKDIIFNDFSLMTTPTSVGAVAQFLFGNVFLNVLKNHSIYGLIEVLIKLFSTTLLL